MIIFGIESSCDDTSAAVLSVSYENGKTSYELLSNIVSTQLIHTEFGGVVPEIASRCHAEAISTVAQTALSEASVTYSDIDAVAVTFAPGLIGSLLVGVSFAKALALSLGVPLIPVNHIEAHAAASYIEHPELPPSFLALIVSGGHTSFYNVDNYDFEEIGGTRDDAAGEAFDKTGRVMGLPYPGGAAMDKLATEGFKRDSYKNIKFPSPAMTGSELEFSFSGLKTAVINYVHTTAQRLSLPSGDKLPTELREDIAAALTDTVIHGISTKLKEAILSTGKKHIVLAGGVAANSHLRRHLGEVCESVGARLYTPSLKLCADNGAMVAAAGFHALRKGITADTSLNAAASDEAAEDYIKKIKNLQE